jgi:uncharacterized peroxidase-related enzyme
MIADIFPSHTADSAPADVRARLVEAKEQFGFVPDPLAKMVTSPALTEAFEKAMATFVQRASLSPVEREVLAMTIGAYNGCEYCVAMHSAISTRMRISPDLVEALRAGTPLGDPRLQALAEFVRSVAETRGRVGQAALESFIGAGFTARAALDVVLGVGVYAMSTYANRMTEAKLDAAFQAFEWHPPMHR